MIRCVKRFNTVVRHVFTRRLFHETIHGTDGEPKTRNGSVVKSLDRFWLLQSGKQGAPCLLREGEGAGSRSVGFWKQVGFKP